MTNLKEIAAKINKLKEEYTEIAKKEIFESFKEFFKNYPEVYAIRWEQYTPHFNDGDACTFSVGEAEYFYSEKDLDNGDYYTSWHEPNYENLKALGVDVHISRASFIHKEFCKLSKGLSEIDSDVFMSIFGDHVQAVATKDGIEVDEYDHD